MTKLLRLILLLTIISKMAVAQDTVKQTLTRAQFIHSQTIKADTLNQLALKLATPDASPQDLDEAIADIMKGLHVYSKYRDSTGLRQTFDHLGLVYHLQKKYVQAKWFYIQSNSLSRERNDTLNIIHSLIDLASVKTDIKDYEMARRDLQEALELSKHKPGINTQVSVHNAYSTFYNKKGDKDSAELVLDRISYLKDSIAKPTSVEKATATAIQQKPAVIQAHLPQENDSIIIVLVSVIILLVILTIVIFAKRKQRNDFWE